MKRESMLQLEFMGGNRRMLTPQYFLASLLAAAIVLAAGLFAAAPAAQAQAQSSASASAQATYASPEEALQALVAAAKDKDRAALAKLFGPDYDQLLSGDEVEDNQDLAEFAAAVQESAPTPEGQRQHVHHHCRQGQLAHPHPARSKGRKVAVRYQSGPRGGLKPPHGRK
jgi:DUF2950 family protein